MSPKYRLSLRTPSLNGLFAGLACMMALALTAGPALAQTASGMQRVEVRGKTMELPVRNDVRASCARIDTQLQDALQTTWMRVQLQDQVRVQFVVDGGEVTSVSARGVSRVYERAIQRAMRELQCQTLAAGPQVYRVRVDFIDPYAMPRDSATHTASAPAAYRVALVSD